MQTVKYYSTPKVNELSTHENTWRKLRCISLSNKSLLEKATQPYDFNYMTF